VGNYVSVDVSKDQQAALDNAAEKCADIILLASYMFTHCPKRLHSYCLDTIQSACDALDAVVAAGGKRPPENGSIPLEERLRGVPTLDSETLSPTEPLRSLVAAEQFVRGNGG
jgi:hypothetical protein